MGYRKARAFWYCFGRLESAALANAAWGKLQANINNSRTAQTEPTAAKGTTPQMRVRQVPNENVTARLAMRTAACGTRRARRT